MSILKDVLAELFGMFVGDARLSVAILAVVAIAAALMRLPSAPPLLAGGVLLIGCLLVLGAAVARGARHR